jgi:hypothetical protein
VTRLLVPLTLAVLTSASAAYSPRIPHVQRIPDRLTVYEIAEITTGASSVVLKGIAHAESCEQDNGPAGDNGHSVGRYQWHDAYLQWYRDRYGDFDPRDPLMSSVRAGQNLVDNTASLGCVELAIAAHRQGAQGVRDDGPSAWYVDRVLRR